MNRMLHRGERERAEMQRTAHLTNKLSKVQWKERERYESPSNQQQWYHSCILVTWKILASQMWPMCKNDTAVVELSDKSEIRYFFKSTFFKVNLNQVVLNCCRNWPQIGPICCNSFQKKLPVSHFFWFSKEKQTLKRRRLLSDTHKRSAKPPQRKVSFEFNTSPLKLRG